MKLNPNCVRDVLLCLEDWLVLTDDLVYNELSLQEIQQSEKLLKYSISEVAYTLTKLQEAEFINAYISYASNSIDCILVTSITYSGHQFIDTVRSPSAWNRIIQIAEKTGFSSIPAIIEIASAILPDLIQSAK